MREGEEPRKQRKKPFESSQSKYLSSATSSRSYNLLAFKPLQNMKYVEDLFVDFGNNYEYN